MALFAMVPHRSAKFHRHIDWLWLRLQSNYEVSMIWNLLLVLALNDTQFLRFSESRYVRSWRFSWKMIKEAPSFELVAAARSFFDKCLWFQVNPVDFCMNRSVPVRDQTEEVENAHSQNGELWSGRPKFFRQRSFVSVSYSYLNGGVSIRFG